MSESRERTFEQEVAAFILNEAMRDYNRLGYFPVPPDVMTGLIIAKRDGKITRNEMLTLYREFAERPE